MRLHEYQSKLLLSEHGIPVPRGRAAADADQAWEVACTLRPPFVVKAQVLVGGRGKAGGIRFADTADEAGTVAQELLQGTVKGLPVRTVLVEEAARIEREIYLSVSVDRTAACPVLVVSGYGGVDIENTARARPHLLAREVVDPCVGLSPYVLRSLRNASGLPRGGWDEFTGVVRGLYAAFEKYDATLAEINPLVEESSGSLCAVDAKMIVDDNALPRQPRIVELRGVEQGTDRERQARAHGVTYVELDGTIGCLVNGAGLAMATMDAVQQLGGSPANFLDIGGGARRETVAAAVRVILSAPAVRAVLVNVLGGITRCDEVAVGVLAGMQDAGRTVRLIVRLSGTNEARGRRLLAESGVQCEMADGLGDAAAKAVAASRSRLVTNGALA
jgi:succinyl-CoA synthetase beta subunit